MSTVGTLALVQSHKLQERDDQKSMDTMATI